MEQSLLRRRLAAPTAAAAVAVLASALWAGGAAGSDAQVSPSGFDGPVAAAPRALDRDVEPGGGALRGVRCVGAAPGTSCWVAR
ncbi:MAG TPA: hypothetical protein VFL60_09860 [Gaiellaceae bacterium]|nr:hypothetical protein [Gaiellaceae bacterium]